MPRHLHYPHFTRLPLALEIALALLIKILILILLWHAFFSTPQTKKRCGCRRRRSNSIC
ncbi:cytochrome oxidase putative small subunit CydP [Undibacterium arcticum]